MQVTVCPAAPHDQPEPVPLAYVKAEFSVSMTVIGLLPVGSPVDPGPLLVTTTASCAFCWPCVKLPPLCEASAVTEGRFSVRFTHQPPAAPKVAFGKPELKNRAHAPLALLPLLKTLAKVEEPWLAA